MKPKTNNKQTILMFARMKGINPLISVELNKMVLEESESILREQGKMFTVQPCKASKKRKLGMCYSNAAFYMQKGYEYVEGYIEDKKNAIKIAHAWNVDKNGNHIDFTLENPENYNYFGMVIPTRSVYGVGLQNGGLWYCVLPYLNEVIYPTEQHKQV